MFIFVQINVRIKHTIGRPKGSISFDPASAQEFGEVVRRKRQELGFSQEGLAVAAEVERSHMGKIERGEHVPNLVLIIKIASALSLSLGSLLDECNFKSNKK